MTFDADKHHRRSIRLKNYDYGQSGAYYITICTWRRRCLLGGIDDGEMRLSSFGEIVREEWLRSAKLRPRVELDAFVVMPNHLHGVIILGELDDDAKSDSAIE